MHLDCSKIFRLLLFLKKKLNASRPSEANRYGTTKIQKKMKHKKNVHFRGNYFCIFFFVVCAPLV